MIKVGNKDLQVSIGDSAPLVLICGPCVIESRDHCLRLASQIKEIAARFGFPLVFKSSFDKANRTSLDSFRGVGIEVGLKILEEIRKECELPVIADIHDPAQADSAAQVVDILQIPAFLCRQTDLLCAAGATGKPVMIKKGQFLAPEDMQYAARKVESGGSGGVLLCERGTCFGYRDLVVDFRSLAKMSALGFPVVFDATHSVQNMGGAGGSSAGNRKYVALLTRAAVSVGIDGLFIESHDQPQEAPSDGPNMISLSALESLLAEVKKLRELNLEKLAPS